MAGVVPVVPPLTGCMDGKLDVETTQFVTFDELCNHDPEKKSFFDELDKKDRRYFLIDCHCHVMLELNIEAASYVWQSYEAPRGGFAYKLAFDFGRRLPRMNLKKVINVESCTVNICSRDFARGVTVDLVNNQVTYVNDALWVSKGEGCEEAAKDILAIVKWLVDDKKFKLAVSGGESYYRELDGFLGGK